MMYSPLARYGTELSCLKHCDTDPSYVKVCLGWQRQTKSCAFSYKILEKDKMKKVFLIILFLNDQIKVK